MHINTVIKRNGETEPFDLDKLKGWSEYAAKQDIEWLPLLVAALEKCHNRCHTKDIMQAMIDACTDIGDEAHLRVAARLMRGDIYKEVYGRSTPDKFSETYQSLVSRGIWKDYNLSTFDLVQLDEVFDPAMDKTYEYASLCQFKDKYGLGTGKGHARTLFETPALALMGIAIDIFIEDGLEHVIKFYDIIKHRKLNIPTPIMASSRTGVNGSASCFVYTSGDTLDSIAAGDHLAYLMSANRAGIGTEYAIRSHNDPVAGGKCLHAGKIPHYKALQAKIETAKQGVRGGAATVSFNVMDPEIDDLLRMKHPTTDETKRFPKMDFSLVHNMDFLRRAIENKDWCLVSLADAPELYHAFYYARDRFSELMDKAIESGIGKIVKARDILKLHVRQWQETGRVYSFNVDHANSHTPFYDVIRLSNLCQEIGLPTNAFGDVTDLYEDPDPDIGLVGLCFLMAVDVARTEDHEYEEVAYYGARALDNIIDKMYYPLPNLRSGQKFRSIGIGMTNMAYKIAKEGLSYDDQYSRTEIHKIAERHQYSLYRASVRLAKERGRFEWYDRCKYKDDILCIDTYCKEIDEYHDAELEQDWEGLRKDMAEYGMRFSTHSAHMPCESSSGFGYSTNGLYPIRNLKVMKSRPEGLMPFPAPEMEALAMNYQLAWDIDTQDLYKFYGIIQKFTCQGISADTYLDKSKYPGERIPMRVLLNNFLFGAKMGMKTNYYFNTDGKSDKDKDIGCDTCDV